MKIFRLILAAVFIISFLNLIWWAIGLALFIVLVIYHLIFDKPEEKKTWTADDELDFGNYRWEVASKSRQEGVILTPLDKWVVMIHEKYEPIGFFCPTNDEMKFWMENKPRNRVTVMEQVRFTESQRNEEEKITRLRAIKPSSSPSSAPQPRVPAPSFRGPGANGGTQ